MQRGSEGRPDPCWDYCFHHLLNLDHFVFVFYSCAAIFFFSLGCSMLPSETAILDRSYLRYASRFPHVSSYHHVTWSKYLQAAEITLHVPPFIAQTDANGRWMLRQKQGPEPSTDVCFLCLTLIKDSWLPALPPAWPELLLEGRGLHARVDAEGLALDSYCVYAVTGVAESTLVWFFAGSSSSQSLAAL